MDECEQVATDGMRLPDPSTLRDAVKEVIRQNQEVGYNPGRFIQATQNGESKDLEPILKTGNTRTEKGLLG